MSERREKVKEFLRRHEVALVGAAATAIFTIIAAVILGGGDLVKKGLKKLLNDRAEQQDKELVIAAAIKSIANEVFHRTRAARVQFDAGRPNKAWNILNGNDSLVIFAPSLQGQALAPLVEELIRSKYDLHGVDKQRLAELSTTPSESKIGEIIGLLETASKQ